MGMTYEQYEFSRERRNYKARLRRRIYKVKWLSYRIHYYAVTLNRHYWEMNKHEREYTVKNINTMFRGVLRVHKEMNKVYEMLAESLAKRTIGFTKDDIWCVENVPCSFEHFLADHNWLENETEEERNYRARRNYLGFLSSYMENCDCLDGITDYDDVDDYYEYRIDGRIPFKEN